MNVCMCVDECSMYVYITTLLHFRQLDFYGFHRSADQIDQTFNFFALNSYILIKIVLYI